MGAVRRLTSARTRWTELQRSRALAHDRRAGVHSRREIQFLQRRWLREHWKLPAVLLLAVLVVAATAWWLLPDPIALFASGFLTASAGWAVYTFMIQSSGIAPKQIGAEAEGWTAQELRRLQRDGWRLVNHVMLPTRDIDHALLGPGGFYSVETKYRSNWQAAERDVDAWANRARLDAHDLSMRLGLKGQGVIPVVAVWTSGIQGRLEGPFERSGVMFCPGRQLREHIGSRPSIVSESEVLLRFERLAEYVDMRDQRELVDAGPQPRSLSVIYDDVAAVVLSSCAAFLAVVIPVRLPPAPLWSVMVAATVAGIAWLARRRSASRRRVQLVATAAMTTSLGLVAVGMSVVGFSLAMT